MLLMWPLGITNEVLFDVICGLGCMGHMCLIELWILLTWVTVTVAVTFTMPPALGGSLD